MVVVQLCPCKLILNSAHRFPSAPVPQCLKTDATLENLLLVFDSVLHRSLSDCEIRKNSYPVCDSLSCMTHPTPTLRKFRAQVSWYQAYRLWFCHHRPFSCPSFLSFLRHGVRLFNWKKRASGKHREIHDVEQTKKMVLLITREITFSQHVSKLVLGVNIFDLVFLGSKLTESNNQSNATLWVLDTCLIVGLVPFVIILITASLSSKHIQLSSTLRNPCVCDNLIHIWQFINISVTASCNLGLGFVLWISPRHWLVNAWSPTFSLRQWSLAAWSVGVGVCSQKNAILLSPHPIVRE